MRKKTRINFCIVYCFICFCSIVSFDSEAEVRESDPIYNYFAVTGSDRFLDICSEISGDGKTVLLYVTDYPRLVQNTWQTPNVVYAIDNSTKSIRHLFQSPVRHPTYFDWVYSLDISNNNRFFFSMGDDGVRVGDIENGQELFFVRDSQSYNEYSEFTNIMGNSVFSPDNRFFIIPLSNLTVFYNTSNFLNYKTIGVQIRGAYSNPVNFSLDLRTLIRSAFITNIVSDDIVREYVTPIELFDPGNIPILHSERFNEKGSMRCTDPSPDGRFLLAGCYYWYYDKYECGLWDLESGNVIYRLKEFYSARLSDPPTAGNFVDVEFFPSGSYFLVARKGSLTMHETKTGTLVHKFNLPSTPLHTISLTNDGKYLLADQYLYSIPETLDETPVDIPNPVIVADSVEGNIDLSFDCDHDENQSNELVIQWDFTKAFDSAKKQWERCGNQVDEYHVYANVNDATESLFLGYEQSNGQNYYIWNKETSLLNPLFQGGPQPGFRYQFSVFGLKHNPGDYPTVIGPLRNWGPIESQRIVNAAANDPAEPSLIVTDDLRSYSDLSGWKDEDSESQQRIYLRWNYPSQIEALDFHIYVKIDDSKTYNYLGRTRYGGVQYFGWDSGSYLVAEAFRSGPQFGHFYRFKVFPIIQINPIQSDKAIANAGPVWYESNNPVSFGELRAIDNAPINSDIQENADSLSSPREIELQWNFPVSDVRDYHVYVSIDGDPWTYLGRTKNKLARNFMWKAGSDLTVEEFRGGPQIGRQYRFMVYAISQSGSPFFHGPLVMGER